MFLRWLFNKTHREARALCNHVRRLLNAQRDLMSSPAVQFVNEGLVQLQRDLNDRVEKKELRQSMQKLEQVAGKWLRPYPHAAWRENVEVLLVALAVAMGIRTFFVQPFKIPTGSMQPTLFGVNSQNLIADRDFQRPTGWERVKEWFGGVSYIHVVAPADGPIDGVSLMRWFLIFNIRQSISVGGVEKTIWFPPDLGEAPRGADPLLFRAGLYDATGHITSRVYHKGDDVINLRVESGDHLFVDRFTYNFRKPERGEIVVFETKGIPEERRDVYGIPPDQFYIKRLVGLPGETLQVGDDRHLVVDGTRLDAATPRFEDIYSFDPKQGPRESRYSGHVNSPMMPIFPDGKATYHIPAGHVMVMGDNTMNSLDSRYWGDFPETSIIGKAFFVYWPLTKRFGIGQSVTAE